MRSNSLAVLVFVVALLAAPALGQTADRWLEVGRDVDGGMHSIDSRTIEQTQKGVFEFWVMCVNRKRPNTPTREFSFKHMYRLKVRERTIQRIDRPDILPVPIPPDSMPEAYMDLLVERAAPEAKPR